MQGNDNLFKRGWYQSAVKRCSPFFNQRPSSVINLLVIHNISLPAGEFGVGFVDQLFMGCLDCSAHSSFADLHAVEVSAHFLIDREGVITQYVSVDDRAWHAGVSSCEGVENCNDYSIGIEMEGTDTIAYSDAQYHCLIALTKDLMRVYDIKPERIVGHADIAPGRKTDPGPSFDWRFYKENLYKESLGK